MPSLFDALLPEQQNQDDARAALEASLAKEDLETMVARPRWVPHDKNPADAVTKYEGARVIPLCRLLETGYWQIAPEEQELAARSAVKDEKGYVPRPRQGVRHGLSTTLRKNNPRLSATPDDVYFTGEDEGSARR